MPQSLSRITVHLVFSTKDRLPLIEKEIQPNLHDYMQGTLHNLKCVPLSAGGVTDHVHLLFSISRTLSVASVVEKVATSLLL